MKDKQGNALYLNKLDIDSEKVFTRLANIRVKDKEYFFIDEMCRNTYVTKTKKRCGRHIYWLSHKQNTSIGTKGCKLGYEFEIKTDNSLGLGTLPPSIHRDYSDFHYQCIGKNTISHKDGFYDGILDVLADCMKIKEDKEKWSKNGSKFKPKYNVIPISFNDEEIQTICDLLSPYYYKGCHSRHDIVFGFGGICLKHNVTKESATKLVESLAKDDEESKSRLKTLEETYNKQREQVSGTKWLLEALEHITGDSSTAKDIFNKIFKIIVNKWSDSADQKKINYVLMLTDEIREEYPIKTIKDTEEIYYYDNNKGVYIQGGEWLIKEQCEILYCILSQTILYNRSLV